MIYIAAEQSGVSISGAQCTWAAGALWQEITRQANFYPDALPFLKNIILHHTQHTSQNPPIYLGPSAAFYRLPVSGLNSARPHMAIFWPDLI